jgi:dihydropteroate synthase
MTMQLADRNAAGAPRGSGAPAATILHSARPLVCGILNVTPDSFSDGGRFLDHDRAAAHGFDLACQGADLIDIGGESTRPGAHPPTVDEELDRVIPVVERLARVTGVPLSVDTSRPEVMRAAVRAGASMINDVRALRAPGALDAAVELGVPVCLMHMQGEPATMQASPHYGTSSPRSAPSSPSGCRRPRRPGCPGSSWSSIPALGSARASSTT